RTPQPPDPTEGDPCPQLRSAVQPCSPTSAPPCCPARPTPPNATTWPTRPRRRCFTAAATAPPPPNCSAASWTSWTPRAWTCWPSCGPPARPAPCPVHCGACTCCANGPAATPG